MGLTEQDEMRWKWGTLEEAEEERKSRVIFEYFTL